MVLLPKLRVSDNDIRELVRKEAYRQKIIHKLPTLLEEGEDYGYRPPSQVMQEEAMHEKAEQGSSMKGKRSLSDSRLCDKKLIRKPTSVSSERDRLRGGLSPQLLDVCSTIAARDGRRHGAADDGTIDVNIYFPFTGDTIKLKVERDLPLSPPRTPAHIRDNRFFQYWGRNADALGYTSLPEPKKEKNVPSSLKSEIGKLTGLNHRYMRVIHKQSKMVFSGPGGLASFGIVHGQTLNMIYIAPPNHPPIDMSLPPLVRLNQAKFHPSLSSSVKKKPGPGVAKENESLLRQKARHQTSKDSYRIMPRWEVNAEGVKFTDLKYTQAADLSDQTIYFKSYAYLPDKGRTLDSVMNIRETFEKQRAYMEKRHVELCSPKKLKTALRVVLGQAVSLNEAFQAWKEHQHERAIIRRDFQKDVGQLPERKKKKAPHNFGD